jgi:hypothetical protein
VCAVRRVSRPRAVNRYSDVMHGDRPGTRLRLRHRNADGEDTVPVLHGRLVALRPGRQPTGSSARSTYVPSVRSGSIRMPRGPAIVCTVGGPHRSPTVPGRHLSSGRAAPLGSLPVGCCQERPIGAPHRGGTDRVLPPGPAGQPPVRRGSPGTAAQCRYPHSLRLGPDGPFARLRRRQQAQASQAPQLASSRRRPSCPPHIWTRRCWRS